jgi:transposase InsO family protein
MDRPRRLTRFQQLAAPIGPQTPHRFTQMTYFYSPKRRHSTIGYVSPAEFERMAELA